MCGSYGWYECCGADALDNGQEVVAGVLSERVILWRSWRKNLCLGVWGVGDEGGGVLEGNGGGGRGEGEDGGWALQSSVRAGVLEM